jgi:hypothetical protein
LKGSLKMKTKLLFLIFLLAAAVAPGALAASDDSETNARSESQLLVTPVEQSAPTNVPTGPAVVPADPKQALQDYDSEMLAITQKFSATLAGIAEAVTRGELSSEQARETSIEQYQLALMQFGLVSLCATSGKKTRREFPMVKRHPILGRETKS